MSIYDNPKEYAKETFMTIQQAEVRCNHYKKLLELAYQAKKCPECGKHTLGIEGGSYEEGYGDYVYCENDKVIIEENGESYETDCDFTSDVEDKFTPLYHWYEFDEVLAFSIDIENKGMENTEKMLGCSWEEFITNSNKNLSR